MEPTLQNPHHRSPLAIFIIVVLIVVAVLLAVWLRQMGLLKVGEPKLVPSDITEAEKRAALSMLDPASGTTTSSGLTNTQKQAALDDIPPPKEPTKLSDQDKQSLLDQLDPQ